MSEEEIIQEIEKLELEEEKEKVIKKLLGIIIEGKKDIIQEKEFFLKKKEKEIEELKKEIEERETRLQEEINENCRLKTELYGNSISKNKIREKLEEVKNKREEEIEKYQVSMLGSAIDILQELLEE